MTAEGHNVDATLMAIGRDHGHYFVRKTFGKPTYCHHCCDKIWGMLTQGYACEGWFLIMHMRQSDYLYLIASNQLRKLDLDLPYTNLH
ncbi:unnamed protein product [Anisakis simplex]|uniref:Diacylglycerol kinase theta (inferred by orthology to a human protein) n=1 Tax=Anisakis simplex TaxID=6269 RepID=A0A0M3JJJ0_ANISI|nr:unnamed protein product [Anisakis simplex]